MSVRTCSWPKTSTSLLLASCWFPCRWRGACTAMKHAIGVSVLHTVLVLTSQDLLSGLWECRFPGLKWLIISAWKCHMPLQSYYPCLPMRFIFCQGQFCSLWVYLSCASSPRLNLLMSEQASEIACLDFSWSLGRTRQWLAVIFSYWAVSMFLGGAQNTCLSKQRLAGFQPSDSCP